MNQLTTHLRAAGDIVRHEPTGDRPSADEIRRRAHQKATRSRVGLIALVALITAGGIVAINRPGGGQQVATTVESSAPPTSLGVYPPSNSVASPNEMSDEDLVDYISRVINSALASQGIEANPSTTATIAERQVLDDPQQLVWRDDQSDHYLKAVVSGYDRDFEPAAEMTREDVYTEFLRQSKGSGVGFFVSEEEAEVVFDVSVEKIPEGIRYDFDDTHDAASDDGDNPATKPASNDSISSGDSTSGNRPGFELLSHQRVVGIVAPTFAIYVESGADSKHDLQPVEALGEVARLITAQLTADGYHPIVNNTIFAQSYPADASTTDSPFADSMTELESLDAFNAVDDAISGAIASQGIRFSGDIVSTQGDSPWDFTQGSTITGGAMYVRVVETRADIASEDPADVAEQLLMPPDARRRVTEEGVEFSHDGGDTRKVGLFRPDGWLVYVKVTGPSPAELPSPEALQEIARLISADMGDLASIDNNSIDNNGIDNNG